MKCDPTRFGPGSLRWLLELRLAAARANLALAVALDDRTAEDAALRDFTLAARARHALGMGEEAFLRRQGARARRVAP